MNLKKGFDTLKNQIEYLIDNIKDNKKYLVSLSLSLVAFLILLVVLFFSNGDFSVSKEVNTLVDSISSRRYTEAYQYYENLEKEFSASKMNKFNKSASNKLSSLVANSGDKYISGEMSREQYLGLINTINALDHIEIDVNQLLDISSRVEEMYIDENISYEKASSYMEVTTSLKGIYQDLDEYKNNIETICQSRKVYQEGSKFQQIKKYKEAIDKYDKVVKEDKKYYSLAQNKKQECIKAMYDYYISQSKNSSKKGDIKISLLGLLIGISLIVAGVYGIVSNKIENQEYKNSTDIRTVNAVVEECRRKDEKNDADILIRSEYNTKVSFVVDGTTYKGRTYFVFGQNELKNSLPFQDKIRRGDEVSVEVYRTSKGSYKIKPDNDIITFLLCCMAIPVGAVVVIIMVLDIFKHASVKRT